MLRCVPYISHQSAVAPRISHTMQKLHKVVQLGIQRGQEGRALGKTFVPEALPLGIVWTLRIVWTEPAKTRGSGLDVFFCSVFVGFPFTTSDVRSHDSLGRYLLGGNTGKGGENTNC